MMVLISVHAPQKNSIDERRVALIFELRTFPTNWLTSWGRKEVKVLEGCMATICMPFFWEMGFVGWVRPFFKISHFKFALVILWHTFHWGLNWRTFFIAHSQHFATFCWPVWLKLYLLEGGTVREAMGVMSCRLGILAFVCIRKYWICAFFQLFVRCAPSKFFNSCSFVSLFLSLICHIIRTLMYFFSLFRRMFA